jgi:hypothetical protein
VQAACFIEAVNLQSPLKGAVELGLQHLAGLCAIKQVSGADAFAPGADQAAGKKTTSSN